ncbi:hypothetical protein CP8484711_0695 [Chlamydia psittaci 84-8471/1]|nr:hypothetical protein CP8484711_0695 [Chlamydia psittaci 84-8471/1]
MIILASKENTEKKIEIKNITFIAMLSKTKNYFIVRSIPLGWKYFFI